jgi:IS30 family transposase
MLAKIKNKDVESIVSALIKQSKKLPDKFHISLTWDRRTELADHERFILKTDINVYFCDPRSPWQRG